MNQKTPLLLTVVLLLFIFSVGRVCGQIRNFNKDGRQITRLTVAGDAVDAHDGEIAQFNGVYYLYGTSYDCGFEWGNKGAPFCGFKVYSSEDLENWTDRGYLFDSKTQVWQSRCDGKTYGCFRPHVIYNKQHDNYVLWINVYDNVIGYRVFTSRSPVGPFTEVAEPKLTVNSDMPAAGLNNGDHDTFVDDDGTAYLAFTDWRTKGTIVIEKLSADYLTGTGECVKMVTNGATEAPGLLKRNGRYYVLYSDPNCGYCSGTGTSYRTAPNPLGPWSEAHSISSNSCGGQPSFVSTIKINEENIYLYGSDLWNNAAKNEALANYYWAPLEFEADGTIKQLKCAEVYQQTKVNNKKVSRQVNSVKDAYISKAAIDQGTQWAQMFTVRQSGKIRSIDMMVFQNHNPDKDLLISICRVQNEKVVFSDLLFTQTVPTGKIGWSPKKISVLPPLNFEKGSRYALVLHTSATKGYYGILAREAGSRGIGPLMYSKKGNDAFTETGEGVMAINVVQ